MQRRTLPVLFALPLGAALALGPAQDEHPSLASRVLATYTPKVTQQRTPAAMAEVGHAFLVSLTDELRARCALPLDHAERANWTNVPPGADELGARLGDLDRVQLERACDLLATVLSAQGYAQARDVMLADDKLLRDGRARVGFGAENYFLVLFGAPSDERTWGLQLDGHHIAINLTMVGDRVTMSPSFLGTQPSGYARGEGRVVPMRGEVEDAFALVASLNEEQRGQALVSARRGRIVTAAGRDGFVPEPAGLACDALDEQQRALLVKLLRHFVGDLPEPYAGRRMAALVAEIDQMHLAWSGPTTHPSDVSYRVQGPSLIVEYACQDLGGDPLDHLHSMYRDPGNEYGAGFSQER